MTTSVLEHIDNARAVMALVFGDAESRPFAVRYWTGEEETGDTDPSPFTIVVRRPGALRRMLLPPSELSIVEAIMSGDIELEGDAERAMALGDAINGRLKSPATLFALTKLLMALPHDDDTIAQVRARRARNVVDKTGARHEPTRDQAAIRYHYDVGNDFYALWLDSRMVYSCAYYATGTDAQTGLEEAQRAKLDLVCRKLQLKAGDRLLDIGCGWGALIMHAAQHYGVIATGITLSEAQAKFARERINAAGLAGQCHVEIRDYRALAPLGHFDAIASVGMVEHVGVNNLPAYFAALHAALRPGGLLLNHGIVSMGEARASSRWDWLERKLWKRDAFIEQYVFPDGRLGPLSAVIAGGESAGFETRDLESLREHYALTLRAWRSRLEAHEEEAIALTDHRTYRTWRLYLTASAYGFASGRLNVVQTLLSKPTAAGETELPRRRAVWVCT